MRKIIVKKFETHNFSCYYAHFNERVMFAMQHSNRPCQVVNNRVMERRFK